MKNVSNKKPVKRWLRVALIVGIMLITCIGAYYFFVYYKNSTKPAIVVAPNAQAKPEPAYQDVAGRYLFNGTVVWARAVEKYAGKNYAQPFSQLDTFNRDAYDAWSTDFECPITNNVVPYQTQIEKLVFNCRPEFLPSAVKYFNLFNLANNHTDNQGGQVGIASTRDYLRAVGVQYFGNYDPTITSDICEVIALPVRLQKQDKTEQKASLPVAFCAWHYFNYFREPTAAELAVVARYKAIMPVFGFVEMGNEYQASASESQRMVAHQLMDTGLDFLLANNPHWVQDAEAYKGKLIVYSLGNFIFDQLDTETQRSASIDLGIKLGYDDNVAKWVALGASCGVFQDSCLTRAEGQKLSKVQLSYLYEVVAGQGGAGKVTRRADAATQKAVEERLNWAAVMKELGQ